MKHLRLLILAVALAAASSGAHADPRIRKLAFDPDRVVRLEGCFGYQTMVEFAPDERIENVGLGEASRWLVTPNKRANMLFVKPAYRTTRSNMTVVTDRRSYAFELVARDGENCRNGGVLYSLRFTYPHAAPPAAPIPALQVPPDPGAPPIPAPEQRNAAYTFSGARENVPQRVFDNGHATFFRWGEGSTTPAVYAVAADKSQTLVNFVSKGDYLVVDQVAPAFVLRRGDAVAMLYNDAYQTPSLDAASPQPRAQAEGRRHGLFSSRSKTP
jgi:type IV secretion system protein VirB9